MMCHYVTMSSFLKVVQRSNITALSLHTHNPLESCATLDASCSNAHHFLVCKSVLSLAHVHITEHQPVES